MLTRLIVYCFFVYFSCSVFSQGSVQQRANDLKQLEPHSEAYLIGLTILTKKYAETRPDSALYLGRKCMFLADKLGNDSLKGQIHIAFSSAWSYLATYDSSVWHAFRALDVAESYHDTTTIIDAYNNLGIDFMFQEQDESAINYYQKVEELSRKFGDSLRLGHALNNLGMMQGYAGNSQAELSYYDQAEEIFDAIGESEGKANTQLNIGTVYTNLEQYSRAERYYYSALRIFRAIGFSSGEQNCLQSIADNAFQAGQFERAEKIAKEALEIAVEQGFAQDIIYTYDLLERIAVEMGDFSTAYQYQQLEADKEKEVFTAEKTRQINELETKYQTARKEAAIRRLAAEHELAQLESEKTRNILIVVSVFSIVVIILLVTLNYFRVKRMTAEKIAQESQYDALQKRFIETLSGPQTFELKQDLDELNDKLVTPLTEREYEALKLSMQGLSNKEIADQLFVSDSTVKFHLRNVYNKLGVTNRKEALEYVIKKA